MPGGRVSVAPRAIAALAANAALQCAGVAGLVEPPGTAVLLRPDEGRRGVEVHLHQNELTVDVYLLVQAGIPIADVAAAVQEQVSAALRQALDIREPRVNVRVQGVRGQ